MTTVAELQTAYQAIIRADLEGEAANAIIRSGVSLEDYIASLIQQSKSTTGAAVALTAFVTGIAPSSQHLTELKAVAELQFAAYYAKLGVANPALGPFEAFGRSLAVDPATKALFVARYGDLGAEAFIRKVYGELYCGGITEGALANLNDQLTYFTKILSDAKIPDAALSAKGAVVGQLIGYAFLDVGAGKNAVIDDQVSIALTHAAHGDAKAYEAALPFVARPCDVALPAVPSPSGPPPAPDTAPPVFTSGATATVAENTAAATIIYQAAATDPSGPLAYSLTGLDAALFSINATTGAVKFLASPDFEAPQDNGANNVYDISVTATDTAGNAASKAVAITVTDVVEVVPDVTPPVFTSSGAASIAENTAATTTVYQAAATDPSGPLTFSLSGLDAALFSINATTGAVKFLASPDFEAPQDTGTNNIYDINVIATDAVGNAASQAVAITVTDVVERSSIWRASVDSSGAQAVGGISYTTPSLSGDGRYVAFSSNATNLVAGDGNARADVFVHDNTTNLTTRVSVGAGGAEAVGGDSTVANISADGRYVAFQSAATNLVAGDTNSRIDAFLYDTQTGTTVRASLSSAGGQGNGDVTDPVVSNDGRYVVFESKATDLIATDQSEEPPVGAFEEDDILLRDMQTGQTIRIGNVGIDGKEPSNSSYSPLISDDGRFVAFQSLANNLVTGDTNSVIDVFVLDRTLDTIERVNVSSAGVQAGSGAGIYMALAANGRYVLFQTSAANLVANDTNGRNDIFRHDMTTDETIRVSLANDGAQANDSSFSTAISANGRYVAFGSRASNLVANDTNNADDVFVRDVVLNKTYRVSVNAAGEQGTIAAGFADSSAVSISDDGRYVSFISVASNLVAGDTNAARDVFVVDGQAQGWWFA